MASQRQLDANRRNGRKGGPKSEAGKQRSRRNSLQHGLTSSTLVVLPEENQREYEEVLRGFRESFRPYDAPEDALVVRLAQAHWRSLRSRRVETGILNITAAAQRDRARGTVADCPEYLNPHNAIAVGFMTMPAERWQMYLRYDTTISRDFFRTLDSLTRLQRLRQRQVHAAVVSQDPHSVPEPLPELAYAAGSGAQLSTPAQDCDLFAASEGDKAELFDSGIRSVSQNDASSLCCATAALEEDSGAAGSDNAFYRSEPQKGLQLVQSDIAGCAPVSDTGKRPPLPAVTPAVELTSNRRAESSPGSRVVAGRGSISQDLMLAHAAANQTVSVVEAVPPLHPAS